MKYFLLIACLGAATAPWLEQRPTPPPSINTTMTTSPLLQEDTTPLEALPGFAGFPGTIRSGQNSVGSFLIREVTEPTRTLHSSYDCFRGSGYHVTTPKVEQDPNGRQWAIFHAERSGEQWKVYEIFTDSKGKSWSDVSSWYWNALLGRSKGPWQAITRIERRHP